MAEIQLTAPSKPTATFWITVALIAVLVAYPLSFGPACWLSERMQPSGKFVSAAYFPILWGWQNGPRWLRFRIVTYATRFTHRLHISGRRTESTASVYVEFRPPRKATP